MIHLGLDFDIFQKANIQVFELEETNMKIYRCVNDDIDRREAEVNITFHTPLHLDTRLFKLLFSYFSVSCVWLMLSKKRI